MDILISTQDLAQVVLLTFPLVVGGILHMAAVKGNVLSYFKKPIHPSWFGQNKTWRGFVIMPLATLPGVWLSQWLENLFDLNAPVFFSHSSWGIALLLGLGYCLAELPNSFVKRRMGIKEGQTSPRFKWLFVIIDQADSAIGCMLAYLFIIPLSFKIFMIAIIFGTGTHLLFNVLLFKVGLRKNPY